MADAQHDPRSIFAEQDRDLGIVTYLGLPIKRGEEVLGVLTFNTTRPHRYTADEMSYLASFADQAAVAIENARLFREERERRMQLEAVRTINAEMTRELDLPALLRLFVGRAMELVRAAGCGVWLWDAELHLLAPHAWEGPDWITDVRLRLGEGVIGEAARRGEGVMVNDYVRSPLAHPLWVERTQTRAVIAEPLRYRDRLLGVIAANREGAGEPFRSEDLQALRLLADHAAIAIEKAQLFQELNQSYANLQKAQDELIRAEKLRALGQMSAGIAHDLNNMLAAILGQVELLRLRARDPEVQEGLRTLETAATDGAHVVRRLQDFARQRGRSPLTSIDLAEVVTEALEITRPRWRDEVQRQGRVIEVEVHLADLPPVLGYAPEVREVLTNLILNAVDAMPTGGTLSLAAEVMKAVESASQPSLPGVESALGGGTPGDGHRYRDVRGGPSAGLRSVLHDQGWARHRAGSFAGVRDHGAARRTHRRAERPRSGHELHASVPNGAAKGRGGAPGAHRATNRCRGGFSSWTTITWSARRSPASSAPRATWSPTRMGAPPGSPGWRRRRWIWCSPTSACRR